jgi:hypothetical protein
MMYLVTVNEGHTSITTASGVEKIPLSVSRTLNVSDVKKMPLLESRNIHGSIFTTSCLPLLNLVRLHFSIIISVLFIM